MTIRREAGRGPGRGFRAWRRSRHSVKPLRDKHFDPVASRDLF